jgi:hypothetical protein
MFERTPNGDGAALLNTVRKRLLDITPEQLFRLIALDTLAQPVIPLDSG